MTTEIDAEGLAAAREAFIRNGGYSFQPEAMSAAIRAYLSASRSTSEAEPVAWRENEALTNRAEVAEYKQQQAINEILPMALTRATTAEASLATMREALEANEKLMLVNKVRHVAEEVAPLWLQNADRLTARALGGSNAE